MRAEINSFTDVYLDRITQLTNKSNQFNLTTKRYTGSEIEKIAKSSEYITLYGRLKDKFGDNGLVSVVIAKKERKALHIELWLMSCRVLKRNFELAMFKELVEAADKQGCNEIYGYYYKTPKNDIVADLYNKLGFDPLDDKGIKWLYSLTEERTVELEEKINIEINRGKYED